MPPARTATAAPRRHTRSSPRARRRARARPRSRCGCAGSGSGGSRCWSTLTVVVGLYVQRTLTYLSVRSQADQQLAIVHTLTRQNASADPPGRTTLNNPATIEQDARALGMVKPGERPYVVTGLPSH